MSKREATRLFSRFFRVLPFPFPVCRGERPVFGTGLFRQQQVAVVAFALDAQALADEYKRLFRRG